MVQNGPIQKPVRCISQKVNAFLRPKHKHSSVVMRIYLQKLIPFCRNGILLRYEESKIVIIGTLEEDY